ncbi:MAG: LPS-assembly protein LptD [Bacteroidetes bacterium]|nr:LPS-assembly protein LptD [Bacteroidota bacterium]
MKVSKDALDVEVKYQAKDSVRLDLRNKKVYLYGEAKVDYGDMALAAAYIEIKFENKELKAKGRIDSLGHYVDLPVFKDNEREVGADTMHYNFATKRGRMQGVRMQEGEGYVLCNRVFRDSSGVIFTDIGKYTTCDLDHPHFYLNARKLKIIPNNKIVFGPSNLVVEDVPLPAYLPFGLFPTKKGQTSGIIIPQYGLSASRGYNLTNGGYYFHLSDYLDEALTFDFYFRGSWGVHSNTRYAKRYKYNGSLNLGYAYNVFGEKGLQDYRISPDYKIRWVHSQDAKAKPGTGFSADVDIVSNQYNLNNSFDANQIVASQYRSSVSYSKMMSGGKYNLRIGMNHSQNTQTREFNIDLPNINFDIARFTPFKRKNTIGKPLWYETIGLSYNTNFANRLSTYDSLLNNPSVIHDFRNGISHSIPISTSFKFLNNHFTLNPFFNYNEFWYFKTIRKEYNPIENKVNIREVDGFARSSTFSANAGINTRIFGTFKFKRNPKVEAIRHVITPSLNFSYSPDFSSTWFNYYRDIQLDSFGNMGRYSIFENGIKGGPGIGRQGIIGLTIINNLELKRIIKTDTSTDYNYIKLIESFNIDGNYNFLADSFNFSNLRFNFRTTLFKKLSVQLNADLDLYARENNRRVNKLQIGKNGNPGHWNSAYFVTSFSLNPEAFKNGRPVYTPPAGRILTDQEWRNIEMYPYNYLDFSVPWNLNINYSLRYSENYGSAKSISNLFNFSGDISLTENWKIAITSGYDVTQNEIAYTSIDFVRDIHCWQFNFNWIPLGERKSFFFTLRAKSTLLQDLKINKRGYWFDR